MFNSPLPPTRVRHDGTAGMTRALRSVAVLLAAAALFAPVAEAQTAGAGVESVTVDSPGIGYTSAPTVVFASGGGSGAAATATLTPSVGSVTLGSGGSGYTTAPSVMFTGGGGGSGATANAVLPARGVASVTLISVGVYSSTPTVTFGPPQTAGGRRATGTVVRPSGGDVQSVTITDPGSGYTSPPSVTFSPGLGVNAIGTAVLEAAAVASVTVTEVGSGYTSVPSVSFSGGGGSGATANAALSNSVLSVSVTSPGSGYTSAPSVSFSGGGGSGAAATATLEATVVTGVALSSPVLGDTFERAEPIEATVTFAHAVDVDTTGGTPQLALNIGSNTRQASYVSGTGTTELKFRYTVVQADVDNNGITIGASALALNGGTIRLAGSSTVDAVLGLGSHAITDSADHKVNGGTLTAAAVSGVSITSTPASGDTYRLGEQIDVTVTFNRTVNVVTTGGTPQLALTVGSNTRQANVLTPSGTSLVFGYTVAVGDFDGDGIGVAAGALTLNSGAINDARDATVAAALGLGTHAISDDADHKVATPPFISTIGVNSPGAGSSTFERLERIEVTLNFNRAVNVTGTPQVALGIGTETRQADYVSGTGTTSPVFRYTVVQADSDPNGISIAANALTLNGGTIRAVTADRTDASLGLGSNAVNDLGSRRVDGTQFTAASVSTAAGAVSIASSPASGDTYGLGERIEVRVRFTQRVDVTGTPQVEMTVGAVPRQAGYASGSGTNSLNFRYVVQNADVDTVDGIAIPANALTLNGGAIDDARDATEAATLTHGAVAADASHKVNGPDLALAIPRVIGVAVVSAPPAGGVYGTGDEIRVRVTFDRLVNVDTTEGTPQLALTVGTETRQAAYVSGSGTPDLVFRYVVRVGDSDPDGISVAADALNDDGTILVVGELTGEAPGTPQPAAERDLGSHALQNQGHAVDAPQPPPPPQPPRPALAIDAPRVTEGGAGTTAALRFTVTMDRTATRAVTVSWEDAGSGTATAGAADAAGADYVTLVPGTLTFAPGTTEQTIEVTVIGDAVDEADETVAVRLHSPENATLTPEAAVGIGTITDDDDADLKPTFGDARVPPQRYVQDVEIAPLVLPAATGGDGPLTYTLTGSGPSGALLGLVYTPPGDAGTGGTLTGTPAVVAEAAPWTLTATDTDGDTATLTFSVEVVADLMPSFGDARVPVQRYVQGTAIAPLVLPAAMGGDLPLTYALTGPGPSGALPEGLTYTPPADAATGGTLTGTPAVAAEEAVWTLTATDADGSTATLTFTFEVEPDLMPSFGDMQVPVQRYVQDVAIAPLVLPAATGGNGPLTYALTGPGPSGALLEGLAYIPPGTTGTAGGATGGTLTGTPVVVVDASTWTLTVTDFDGDTATLTFSVEVEADSRPTFGAARVPAQRYVQDMEIAPLALPAATGGNGALTYTLTPVLPEGLTYTPPGDAAGGGTLAGTPAVPVAPAAWTLAATDVDGDRATLTLSIEVLDRLRERLRGVNEAILADLSRAMTASTVDAVAGRIGQGLAPGGAASGPMASAELVSAFAGVLKANEEAIGEETWSWKRGLDGRRFALALSGAGGDGAGADVTVWGGGDYRTLDGDEGSGVDWDGHLFGAHLGLDTRFGAGGLAGLALSLTEGRLDYTDTSAYVLGDAVEGEYESRMTSAHPYLGWAWGTEAHAWASLGYGRGEVTITDGEAGRQESGSTLRSAAAGGSVRVVSGEGPGVFGPMAVDVKGEAWATRLAVEENGERIAGVAVRTHRVRVSAEGSRAFVLGGGAAFTPSVELGMRLDGGDGETGAGLELGGGVDYAHPARGLSADVSGRVLVAHEGGSDDWSVGGAVRLEPASGLGLSLRLAPSYGETGGGLARLWERGVTGTGAIGAAASASNDPSPSARLDTEMGYGVAAFAGVLTPYGGFALSEGGAHGYRVGARFLLGAALELGVEGERREGRSERAEHGLMLRGRMRW